MQTFKQVLWILFWQHCSSINFCIVCTIAELHIYLLTWFLTDELKLTEFYGQNLVQKLLTHRHYWKPHLYPSAEFHIHTCMWTHTCMPANKTAHHARSTCIFSTGCVWKLTSSRHDIIVKDWRDKASGKNISLACYEYNSSENEQIVVVFPPSVMKLWSFLCPYLYASDMRNCTSFARVSRSFWMDALYYIRILSVCFHLSSLLLRRESNIWNSRSYAHQLWALNSAAMH